MVEAASSPNLIGLFGLNGYLFAAQLVNFLIVLFAVHRFIYKPLLKAIDARAELIRTSLLKAEASESVLQDAQKRASKLVRGAEQEAQELLEKTKQEADVKRKELLLEARTELDRQVAQTKLQIQEERVQMLAGAKKQLAKLVIQATDAVTDDVLQGSERRTLLETAVKKLTT
jgi:F-type H+-transporting ATPase subunit b